MSDCLYQRHDLFQHVALACKCPGADRVCEDPHRSSRAVHALLEQLAFFHVSGSTSTLTACVTVKHEHWGFRM